MDKAPKVPRLTDGDRVRTVKRDVSSDEEKKSLSVSRF